MFFSIRLLQHLAFKDFLQFLESSYVNPVKNPYAHDVMSFE